MTARRRSEQWSAEDDDDTTVLPPLTAQLLDQLEAEMSGETAHAAPSRSGELPRVEPRSDGGSSRRRADRRRDDRAARAQRKNQRRLARRKRGRRMVFALTAALFCLGALGFAGMKVFGWQGPSKDYEGPAGPAVVIQVDKGDTASQIADTMVNRGVVAASSTFYRAAIHNDTMPSVQPGYYAIPTHISGSAAVDALVDKQSRVGNLVLSDGRQLFDSRDAHNGSVKEGIYRKISQASCYGPAEQRKCVSIEQLETAGASPDLAALGVPRWAAEAVQRVPDHKRQLEGLLAAGSWDFDPSAAPTQILRQLIAESTAGYEHAGILRAAAAAHQTPYQMLIEASLVEREALPQDMSKVARVIVNRLGVNQRLEFDSTVNYDLPETAVATTDAARARVTPWNTYASAGLPATPISAPSIAALQAVESPAPGPWLYFVTVDKKGTTLFTADYQEHLRNVKLAEGSGILDTARQCPPSGCPR